MTAFITPTGRLVFGDPFKPEPIIDDTTKKQKLGPDGLGLVEYIIGVAFPKADPTTAAFLAEFRAADRAAWPQFFGPDGNLLPGVTFADKITDGDGYNKKGQHYGARDGWAGHWVVRFVSRFAPTCAVWDGSKWVQTLDASTIKPGYYVKVSGTTVSNQSTQSPGMYRNLNQVALQGYGPEIVRGTDPNETFGAGPSLPPGASATPVGPGVAPPAVAAAGPPPAPVAPAPTPPPVPVAPPAAPVRAMTAKAAGATYESFVASGWTDAAMVAEGYLVA